MINFAAPQFTLLPLFTLMPLCIQTTYYYNYLLLKQPFWIYTIMNVVQFLLKATVEAFLQSEHDVVVFLFIFLLKYSKIIPRMLTLRVRNLIKLLEILS